MYVIDSAVVTVAEMVPKKLGKLSTNHLPPHKKTKCFKYYGCKNIYWLLKNKGLKIHKDFLF